MEKNREPRNKLKSLWSINIWQRRQEHKMEQKQFFKKWCWDIWTATCKKNETRSPAYAIHKNKFKVDKRVKYKSWYHKSPRGEHKQENLRYSTQQYFHWYAPRARDIKERINKWDLIKIKSYAQLKKTSPKWKWNQLYGKTYLPMFCKHWDHTLRQGYDFQNM